MNFADLVHNVLALIDDESEPSDVMPSSIQYVLSPWFLVFVKILDGKSSSEEIPPPPLISGSNTSVRENNSYLKDDKKKGEIQESNSKY